jgi:cation:H+ antiporter
MWWIWILYIICIVMVIYASSKLAGIVDELDKKTQLSGAFLGAVLLAGVTSLPELVTSITGALLGEANMTLGNILGSNVFDIAIIGTLMLIFCKHIAHKHLSKSNVLFVAFTLVISILVLLCMIFGIEIVIPVVNINILTPIIIVLYVIALISTRHAEPKVIDKDKADVPNKYSSYSVKRLWHEFTILSMILVGVSIAITFLTENIADTYSLGRGLAGALFLGVATSLPEIIASFQLVRLGNFDAAYGDIIGSCLFNFGVISLADIVFTKGTVFMADTQSLVLSATLAISSLCMLGFGIIRRRGRLLKNSMSIQIVFGSLIV